MCIDPVLTFVPQDAREANEQRRLGKSKTGPATGRTHHLSQKTASSEVKVASCDISTSTGLSGNTKANLEPLAGSSTELPASPIPKHKGKGKATSGPPSTNRSLTAREPPPGNSSLFGRSIGEELPTLPDIGDSTFPLVRLPRLSGENGISHTTRAGVQRPLESRLTELTFPVQGTSTDLAPSRLRDAMMDDTQISVYPHSSLIRRLSAERYGGGLEGRAHVGPRLWPPLDIPRDLNEGRHDQRDGLRRDRHSSSSSGYSCVCQALDRLFQSLTCRHQGPDDTFHEMSPQSSVSSLASPHTLPEFISPTSGGSLHGSGRPILDKPLYQRSGTKGAARFNRGVQEGAVGSRSIGYLSGMHVVLNCNLLGVRSSTIFEYGTVRIQTSSIACCAVPTGQLEVLDAPAQY